MLLYLSTSVLPFCNVLLNVDLWKYYMYSLKKYSWKYTIPKWNNKLDARLMTVWSWNPTVYWCKLHEQYSLQAIYPVCSGSTTVPWEKTNTIRFIIHNGHASISKYLSNLYANTIGLICTETKTKTEIKRSQKVHIGSC